MKPLKQLIVMALLVSLSFAGVAAQLTSEQQQAKKQGNIYWYQYNPKALPLLLIAAQAGDEESQYNLAEYLSGYGEQLPKEYQNNAYWYEAAANQGNVYAMYRLNQLCENYSQLKQCHNSTDHWSKTAMATLKSKIAANDPEALYQYYIFTRDIDYLEKSAEANFPEGQYRYGVYFDDKKDDKNTLTWYEKAANNGHVKAMFRLSSYFAYYEQKPEKAGKYLLKAIDKNYIEAMNIYQQVLSSKDDDGDGKYFNVSYDPLKGYAYAMLLEKINDSRYAIRHEPDLTPEQIKEAKAFAEQWQKEHPPLSYYQSPVFNGSLDR